jgi:hypothetical protein
MAFDAIITILGAPFVILAVVITQITAVVLSIFEIINWCKKLEPRLVRVTNVVITQIDAIFRMIFDIIHWCIALPPRLVRFTAWLFTLLLGVTLLCVALSKAAKDLHKSASAMAASAENRDGMLRAEFKEHVAAVLDLFVNLNIEVAFAVFDIGVYHLRGDFPGKGAELKEHVAAVLDLFVNLTIEVGFAVFDIGVYHLRGDFPGEGG